MTNIKIPKTSKTVHKITDFSVGLDKQTSANIKCYNYKYDNGALVQTNGFKPLIIPQTSAFGSVQGVPSYPQDIDILSLHLFKDYRGNDGRVDKIFYYGSDKKLHYCRINSYSPAFRLFNITFNEMPKSINYKLGGVDYILLFNATDGLYTWDGINECQLVNNAPNISSLCVCGERLFVCLDGDKTLIRYSTNTDITTWTGVISNSDNTISLNDERGSVNSLMTFYNYVYAFRDYGITRISLNSGGDNATLYQLYSSGSRIYGNTVKKCGNKIIMFCKDGLYAFDGNNVKKIELALNKLLDKTSNEFAVAEYIAGKYYLACRLNYDDNTQVGSEASEQSHNNALVCLDVNTNEYEIVRGVDISGLLAVKFYEFEKLIACFHSGNTQKVGEFTEDGKDFECVQNKCWVSPMYYLGKSSKNKIIKEISIDTKYDVVLTIFSDRESRQFSVGGKDTPQTIRTNINGKKFGIKLQSNCQYASISNLEFKVEYLDE